MRRRLRILTFIVLGLAVLLGVGWVALQLSFSSSMGRAYAASRLSQVLGAPVEIESLEMGPHGLKAKVRMYEPSASQASPTPWLNVESVETDVSLVDLLLNRATPNHITARSVLVTLKLDQDGKLLTQLPTSSSSAGSGSLPAIALEDASVRIEQQGKPDFVITGIQLRLDPADIKARIEGSVNDPQWGAFTISGEVEKSSLEARLAIESTACSVNVDLLRTVPLVPASTWQHLDPRGHTRLRANASGPLNASIRYEVVLEPDGQADIHLPDLGSGGDATLKKIVGTFRLTAEEIELKDVKGTLAEGSVSVNGKTQYVRTPTAIDLQVVAAGLDVTRLPSEWNLPSTLAGTLRGSADLKVIVREDGSIEPRGGGEAVIDLANLPPGASGDLKFQLRSNGKRYHFNRLEPKEKTSRLPSKRHRIECAAQPPAAPKNGDKSTNIDAELTLRNIDIADLLKQLKVSIPYQLSGKVDTRLRIAVPLEKAGTFKAYRFAGHIESSQIQIEGLSIEKASAELNYENGVLTLVSLKGSLPIKGTREYGSFSGTAKAQLAPRGDLTASLDMTQLPIGEVLKVLAGVDVVGQIDGQVRFAGPIEQLKEPQKWTASAEFRSRELQAYGRRVSDARVTLAVDKGLAKLTDTRATFEGLPVVAEGLLELTAPYKYTAKATTSTESTADIRKLLGDLPLPLAIQGKFKIEGEAAGTLNPLQYRANGSVLGTEIVLGSAPANAVSFDWAVDETAVSLSRLSAKLFGGTLSGNASIPFAANRDGTFLVEFKDLDSALAVKSLEKFPLALTGKLSGGFKGRVPAAKPGQDRTVVGDFDLKSDALTIQGLPAERLTGSVRFADEAAAYQLEGHTLGGTFDLKGSYPFRPAKPEDKEPSGRLNLRNLNLGQLSRALKKPTLAPLTGLVNLSVQFSDDLSAGSGNFKVTSLAWDRQSLSESITGRLRLKERILSVQDVSGTLAGGQLRAVARFVGQDPRRNFFKVTLTRADSQKLLLPLPPARDAIKGQLSFTITGRLDRLYSTGAAQVELREGSIFGVGVTSLQVPVQWSLSGTTGGEVLIRNAYTQAGQGRITGALAYRWGAIDRLEGRVDFQNVMFQSLAGESKLLGAGSVTGRLDIGGGEIRSVNDLRGTLRATLNNTSVRELPVLSAATPFLNVSGLASPFQAGDVVGRFQNGLFNLERLALSNSSAQLFGSGIVTLATGKLDLRVVALTGNYSVGARGLSLLASRIPAFGPIPIGLIRDINEFLSNRTIRLSVTGTVKTPVVQVNTAALLTDEAVRFFLGRYVFGAAGIETIYAPGKK